MKPCTHKGDDLATCRCTCATCCREDCICCVNCNRPDCICEPRDEARICECANAEPFHLHSFGFLD